METEPETKTEREECNICGRKCDGVHSIKISNGEEQINKMVNVLMSYDEKIIDEIIKRINENRRLMSNLQNVYPHKL